MRAVLLTSLVTGMVLGLATGPYAGKKTGETALFRMLFDKLRRGELVLADRAYGGWFMLALLRERGVEFVTRLHQDRTADFSKGKRLGKKDHIVNWVKPQGNRATWLRATVCRIPRRMTDKRITTRGHSRQPAPHRTRPDI